MGTYQFSLLLGSVLALLSVPILGCGTGSDEPGAGTSEIQSYVDANPDKVAKPEDSPIDEDAEFAAGSE